MSHLDRFHSHLRQNKFHCTRQRDALFEAVLRHQPISPKILHNALANSLSRSALFRLIKQFEAADIIFRSRDGLIRLSDRFSQHHHLELIGLCRTCQPNNKPQPSIGLNVRRAPGRL